MDITTEAPIPLAEATKLIPPARRGKRTHISTLVRWITRGYTSPTGSVVVRLEAVRLGSRWMTSREAIQRFAQALTPRLVDTPIPTTRTPGQRQRAAERAAAELTRVGI